MFDIKGINKRYFGITLYLEEDGEEKKVSINVEPPKVKTLKKLPSLANSSEDKAIDELEEAIIELLNKNKERIKVNEYVEELTIDEMTELLTAFFKWLNEEKKAKN